MQTIVNDKDRERPSHPDTDEPIEEKTESKRLDRIADEAAGRGRARQRQDEAGKDIIVQSDGLSPRGEIAGAGQDRKDPG
jgi:hypothetical protein